jgi:pentapeptide MXKDX repeat protein
LTPSFEDRDPITVPNQEGDLLVRRFATIALSLSLMLGLSATPRMFAQDPEKKDAPKAETPAKTDAPKTEAPKPEAAKTEAPKADAAKTEAPKADASKAAAPASAADTAPPPIPPEVEAKLEAARRAVAEAIVAAQDAGLVQTSIDPPPVLDILITGRANDEAALKARTGVSPEVFGAWFSGYGKSQGIDPSKDVRIVPPSSGLKTFYNDRANILNRHIKAVRDAKPAKPKEETKKEETKKEETKEEVKKEEPKKEEPKKEETKKEESK